MHSRLIIPLSEKRTPRLREANQLSRDHTALQLGCNQSSLLIAQLKELTALAREPVTKEPKQGQGPRLLEGWPLPPSPILVPLGH